MTRTPPTPTLSRVRQPRTRQESAIQKPSNESLKNCALYDHAPNTKQNSRAQFKLLERRATRGNQDETQSDHHEHDALVKCPSWSPQSFG